MHTVSATYSKSAGSVSTAKWCTQFQTSRLVSVLRRQSTRGTLRHQPGYGVDKKGGNPITSLRLLAAGPQTCCSRSYVRFWYSLKICLGLISCSHCILLCIPNSTPSLLSCMGSLIVTERHVWVQHQSWFELVMCSLICNVSIQFANLQLAWCADCGVRLLTGRYCKYLTLGQDFM